MLCVRGVSLPTEHISINIKQLWLQSDVSGTFHLVQLHWAQGGEECLMLDPWEAKNQNFCGILYKPWDAAPLSPTSVHSIKSAHTPS